METNMKTADAAKILGVSTKTIVRYIKSGIIQGIPRNRGLLGRYQWEVDENSIEQLLKETTMTTPNTQAQINAALDRIEDQLKSAEILSALLQTEGRVLAERIAQLERANKTADEEDE